MNPAPHLTLALLPPQLCCVCHGPGGAPCPWCHLIACDGCMPELHGAADGEPWRCGQRKALREWEAMDHAVAFRDHRWCRGCHRPFHVRHYPPSVLRKRGNPLCRACIRRDHRQRYGYHPQRRYAHEATT